MRQSVPLLHLFCFLSLPSCGSWGSLVIPYSKVLLFFSPCGQGFVCPAYLRSNKITNQHFSGSAEGYKRAVAAASSFVLEVSREKVDGKYTVDCQFLRGRNFPCQSCKNTISTALRITELRPASCESSKQQQ